MKLKKKLLVLIGGVGGLALVGLLVGLYLWNMMQQPLYQPGMVRAGQNLRAPLAPSAQTGAADTWQVEPDIQLHHFSAGTGRPVLVVHGGPGYPYTQPWTGLEPLTAEYQFHYYDQRGCGESTRPFDTFASPNYSANLQQLDQTLGLGAQIADLERIRQILGQEKLILIGHSFGGFLATLYAAEFPERVEALILVAPADVLVMPPPSGGLYELVRQRLPADQQAAYADYLKRYLNFGNVFSKSEADLIALNDEFVPYYAAAEPGVYTLQPGRAGGWMVTAMYLSMGQRHDYRSALKAVTAPVLVLHGANDLQPEEASRAYAAAFPNAQFQVIADTTHFPFEEQPEAFAEAVGGFLDQLP